ncbi:MAG: hypothetical protein AAFV53_29325 [Myxococcota bacterium]
MSLLYVWGAIAFAQSPPARQIPPSVLSELRVLENRFDIALAADCDADRCFSKGCTYVDHSVADQPRSRSLPGFSMDPGPGSVPAQEYLTRAQCAFAHEQSEDNGDIQALARRLQTKMSSGWTVVSVTHQTLQPLPAYLRTPPELEEDVTDEEAALAEEGEEPVVEPDPWSGAVAGRELWVELLPHFFWMIAVVMGTIAAMTMIWAWRRVGQASFEEQALLAQLARGEDFSDDEAGAVAVEEDGTPDPDVAVREMTRWQERLDGATPGEPDPEMEALIRGMLREGEMPLLAGAMLRFPERFPAAFPSGGDVAAAKVELAEYLKTVDERTLMSDDAFFEALNRRAMAASLSAQSDAQVVRSLEEDFGASGIVKLIDAVPPRIGALLFALSPKVRQQEMVRLLAPQTIAALSEETLRSDRMDRRETDALFAVLKAARRDAPLPPMPADQPVSDRGPSYAAASALSVLLPRINPERRAAIFSRAVEQLHGSLPEWTREILIADMLTAIPDEARNDLLLDIDVNALAAWVSLLDSDSRARLLRTMPGSLSASVGASMGFASRAQQVALAEQGRRALAGGFLRQLARLNLSFEQVLAPSSSGGA